MLAMISAWVAVEADAAAGDVEIALAAEVRVLEAADCAAKGTGAFALTSGLAIRAGPGSTRAGAQACAELTDAKSTSAAVRMIT